MGSYVIQVLSTLSGRPFFSSARASRGQRKSYIRDGARVSREPGSCVLLWFKRKLKDCLQSNVVVDSRRRARARARKLRAQSKKPRYFEGSRAKIPSNKMIGGTYVLKTLTLSWQRSIVRLLIDCKTVGFFLQISKKIFSLVPDLLFYCSRVLEYAKLRTVLQSSLLMI